MTFLVTFRLTNKKKQKSRGKNAKLTDLFQLIREHAVYLVQKNHQFSLNKKVKNRTLAKIERSCRKIHAVLETNEHMNAPGALLLEVHCPFKKRYYYRILINQKGRR